MKIVVTLNETYDPLEFAQLARDKGADLLEIRDDVSPVDLNLEPLSKVMPLLVARRKQQPLSGAWISQASYVDQEIALPRQELAIPLENQIFSHHAGGPMSVLFALEMWRREEVQGCCIKHVEVFSADSVPRLHNLRELLKLLTDQVTVLPMGGGAREARIVLAEDNQFYYCKLDEKTESAPGQELLEEAVARIKG